MTLQPSGNLQRHSTTLEEPAFRDMALFILQERAEERQDEAGRHARMSMPRRAGPRHSGSQSQQQSRRVYFWRHLAVSLSPIALWARGSCQCAAVLQCWQFWVRRCSSNALGGSQARARGGSSAILSLDDLLRIGVCGGRTKAGLQAPWASIEIGTGSHRDHPDRHAPHTLNRPPRQARLVVVLGLP